MDDENLMEGIDRTMVDHGLAEKTEPLDEAKDARAYLKQRMSKNIVPNDKLSKMIKYIPFDVALAHAVTAYADGQRGGPK